MSYILNALKKSEQERIGDLEATKPSQLPNSLNAPAAIEESKTPKRLIAIGGLGAAGLIAVAVWAAAPWSKTTSRIAAPPLAGGSQIVDSAPGAPAPQIEQTTASRSPNGVTDQSATVSVSSPTPTPAQEVVETDTKHQAAEPSIGGQLARQRTPRPIGATPTDPTRLAALTLEPPARETRPDTRTENTNPPRPAIEVRNIPAPPGVTVQVPRATPTNRSESVGTMTDQNGPTGPDSAELEARLNVAAASPVPADRITLSEAADLHEKGWAYERSGDFDSAILSFSRALELRPDFADAYFGRAWIHDRMDQLDQAATDYGQALRIEPKFAAAYGGRGVARFYLDDLAKAEADFAQTMQLGRGELRRFAVLWRYLSTEHDGRDGTSQLATDTQGINLERWPGVIAQYYLGDTDENTVLQDARDPNGSVARERLCVAHFFIAQKYLLDGDAAKARDHFQLALDTGVTEFIQYKAAQRELDRIARLR